MFKTYDENHHKIFFFDILLRNQIYLQAFLEIGFIPISIFKIKRLSYGR